MRDLTEPFNTFSIIMPSWNRVTILPKAINSVLDQTYPHWELIIIDDGSDDGTAQMLKEKYANNPKIKIITHEKPLERVISWNEGMRMATKDWICFLDSDDEWLFGYLEVMNWNINQYPDYKMFHFGFIRVGLNSTRIMKPAEIKEDEKEGMEHFDTGKVGTGGFIFKRECLDNITWMPEVNNVFDLADWFGEQTKKYWKERGLKGKVPEYSKAERWCGNPWGNDYVLSWLVSRKYKSKILPIFLNVRYIRTEPWRYERAITSGTMGG